MPLKQTYCGGSMYCHYSAPQKIRTIVAVPKNTAIDPMYSSGSKKRCDMRHIAAVFAPVTKNPLQ